MPTAAREPALTTERVDLVIATFTYNTDRDTRIDFSRAYYKATGPAARHERLAGPAASATRGQDGRDDERLGLRPWVKNCFKDTKLIVTDGFTNALLAFRAGARTR